jgi:hypothetical protein
MGPAARVYEARSGSPIVRGTTIPGPAAAKRGQSTYLDNSSCLGVPARCLFSASFYEYLQDSDDFCLPKVAGMIHSP